MQFSTLWTEVRSVTTGPAGIGDYRFADDGAGSVSAVKAEAAKAAINRLRT
jgi:hypothetical protein